MSYNGWTNYETWLVNLWLENDGSSEYLREQAADMFETKERFNKFLMADTIEAYVRDMEDQFGLPPSNLFTDLLGAALQAVNWEEIADHYAEDLPELETEDEPI